MSAALYSTRLLYIEGRVGLAKLRGNGQRIDAAPRINGADVVEIDYTPEVGVHRIRERHQGWRDMERAEILAADAYLREQCR